MKQLLLLICMFIGVQYLHAQTPNSMPSHISVHKDAIIDSLIQKRLKLYTIAGTLNGKNAYHVIPSKGYRIQIFYGNNRKEVFSKQASFRNLYPDMGTYLSYKEPNYYLKVGDFRNRQEAQEFLIELRKYFRTTFIKYETINPAKLKPLENDSTSTDIH